MFSERKHLRKKYCIFGCDKLDVHIHNFPHPLNHHEWHSSWIAVFGDKLIDEDPMKIYKNKRVCDYLFKPEEITAGRRVIFGAVPTLNLNGVFKAKYSPRSEHNYASHNFDDHLHAHQSSIQKDIVQESHLYDIENNFNSQPSTSQVNLNTDLVFIDCNQPSSSTGCFSDQIKVDSSSESKSKLSTCVHHRFKSEQKQIHNLKKEVFRLRKKTINFKERLSSAKKLSYDMAFQQVGKKLTAAGKIFTQMQFRQTYKKSKGRRFTLDEKVLSLSLFKRSPKCYTLLSKYFTLPSVKVIKKLLSAVKIGPGINDAVFNQLKETVVKMSKQERLCTLIFDEMSITPQINYNAATDELKGFAHGHENKLADHALVFMIKGIIKNYKQPVAYFTQHLKKSDLKQIIKDIVTNIQKTGLIIICTVCDQSTINVSTMNTLVEDTRFYYIKNGKEWKNDFYEINNKTIIPLYDVPHLIKGIRNNLITKNLKY